MNRDYALKRDYEARVAILTLSQGLAFACASIEHGLPMWEHHPVAILGRAAVDEMWAAAETMQGDPVAAAQLRRRLETAIPHADDDSSMEGSLVRIGGVMVLEALAFMQAADVRALSSCCGSHFDLLNYAVDIYLRRDPGPWEELGEFESADPVFSEEWRIQQSLLADVETWTDGRYVPEWRVASRRRGRDLAAYFGIAREGAQ